MDRTAFKHLLRQKPVLILDGATGTNLTARGLESGHSAEEWVLTNPQAILQLNKDFITAGADVLLTCTFGASRLRLQRAGLENQLEAVNRQAVEITRQACAGGALVAASLGPTGEMLAPFGSLSAQEAEEAYYEQAGILESAGVDLLVVETQFDLAEARAALRGVRRASSLPVVCSFSFDRGTRTMMGVRPRQLQSELGDLEVDAFGINCGRSLDDNYQALLELKLNTTLPVWFKPNAGLPVVDDMGNPVYSVTPEEMGSRVPQWLDAGARFIGGCCGTSPAHLAAIAVAARQNLPDPSQA